MSKALSHRTVPAALLLAAIAAGCNDQLITDTSSSYLFPRASASVIPNQEEGRVCVQGPPGNYVMQISETDPNNINSLPAGTTVNLTENMCAVVAQTNNSGWFLTVTVQVTSSGMPANVGLDDVTKTEWTFPSQSNNTPSSTTTTTETGPTVSFILGLERAAELVFNFSTRAQPAVWLVLDEDAIDNGLRYYNSGGYSKFFSTQDVNDDIAKLAQRKQLRFFAYNIGATISLLSGQVGDEGWFAPKVIPASWITTGPTGNGISNFVGNPTLAFPHNVGKGLGAGSDPEKYLDKIPYVAPLRAEGLWALIGRTVCAVVYDSDISINYGPLNGSLKGATLGVAAFTVLNVQYLSGFSSSTLPKVTIQIVDANVACAGELNRFNDAPEPKSSSQPYDIRPNNSTDNSIYYYVTR